MRKKSLANYNDRAKLGLYQTSAAPRKSFGPTEDATNASPTQKTMHTKRPDGESGQITTSVNARSLDQTNKGSHNKKLRP